MLKKSFLITLIVIFLTNQAFASMWMYASPVLIQTSVVATPILFPSNSNYTYDVLSQLKTTTGALVQSYSYNKVGSRTTALGTAYTVNSLHQYTQVGANVYTYNGNGNLTNTGTAVYTYDEENRLKTQKRVREFCGFI